MQLTTDDQQLIAKRKQQKSLNTNAIIPYTQAIESLKARMQHPLPGVAAQLTMTPPSRLDASQRKVEGKNCREGAVLVLLYPLDEEPALVLTVRPDTLRNHAGQISFPGGRRDENESLLQTALRECEEEIGIPSSMLNVLGPLSPLYIPPSNFCVYPFVACVDVRPEFRPAPAEVQHILEVPVSHLLKPQTRQEAEWSLNGTNLLIPYYAIAKHQVWGATAAILAELLELFLDGIRDGSG